MSPLARIGLVAGCLLFACIPVAAAGADGGAPAAPAKPSGFVAVAGDASIAFRWDPPDLVTGGPVDHWEVRIWDDQAGTVACSVYIPLVPTCVASRATSGYLPVNGLSLDYSLRAFGPGGASEPTRVRGVTPSGPPTAPAPPRASGVRVVEGSGTAQISWAPSPGNGGSPITSYVVTTWDDHTSGASDRISCRVTSTSCSVAVPSTTNFALMAENAVGRSDAVYVCCVTSFYPPGPITSLDWSDVGVGSLLLDGAQASNGHEESSGLIAFEASVDGGVWSRLPWRLDGLRQGAHRVELRAKTTTTTGWGSVSMPGASTATFDVSLAAGIPDPGTDLHLKRIDEHKILVSWTRGGDGGSPLTEEQVLIPNASAGFFTSQCSAQDGQPQCSLRLLPWLMPSPLQLRLSSCNLGGCAIAKAKLRLPAPRPPEAPAKLEASLQPGSANVAATVTATLPESNGGSRITELVVTAMPGSRSCRIDVATSPVPKTASCTVAKLAKGSTTRLSARFRNDAGTGPATELSVPVPR